MPDNIVQVKIQGEDDAGGAFAKATAEAKAFSRVMSEASRNEVKSNLAASDAIGAHREATILLGAAERELARGEQVLAAHAANTADKHRFLGTVMSGLAGTVSGLGRLLGGAFGGGNATSGLTGALDSAGNAMASAAAGGSGMAGMLAVLAPAIAAAALALMPFIANLALVAAGIGVFAAVAIPEITKVWHAVSVGGKAWQSLSPMQKQAGRELRDLQGEFHKLSKALQPEILKAFDEALRIMKDLMPAIRPLAVAAGKAIDGLLKNIDHWLRSSSGQKFLHWMEVDGPKALATFGRVAWDTAKIIGRVFDFMYNTGETFDRHWKVFWHDMAKIVDGFRIGFTQMGHLIVADWNSVFHSVATIGANFARGFQQLGHEILFTVDGVVRGFQQMGSAIAAVWNGVVGAVSSAVNTIEGLISGLNSALGGIPGKVLGALGLASGGIVGAAAGGPRTGLTLVGERGPELVRLPSGSTVMNATQTAQALGGGGQIVIELHVPPGHILGPEFWTAFQKGVRVQGGSSQIVTRKVKFA